MNLRRGQIGAWESVCLAILIGVSNCAFLMGGRSLYAQGNQVWLAVLAGAALSLGIFFLVGRAMLRRGCDDLAAFFEDAVGVFLSCLLGTSVSCLLLLAAALPLVRVLFTLQRFIFVDAGMETLAVYVLLALLPLTLFGLESLARTAKLVCVPVLAAYLLMLLLGIPDYAVYRLYPLYGGGAWNFLMLLSISVLCFLPPLLLLLIFGEGVHGIRHAMRFGSIAAMISGVFSLFMQVAVGMAFSYRQLRQMDAPIYRLILSVRGGMQMRLDKILLSVWLAGILLGAAALLYGASLHLCLCFRLRDVRPVCAVFSVLCTTVILLGHSADAMLETGITFMLYGAGAVLTACLIITCLISFLKKGRPLCENAV